jgi:hypothetical protein
MEADQARDAFAAIVPAAHGNLGNHNRLAPTSGLPQPTLPRDWRVISSGAVTTELGPVIEVDAVTADGIEVAVIASRRGQRTNGAPTISYGDDERIASWGDGNAAYAMAAQTSSKEMKRLVREMTPSARTS